MKHTVADPYHCKQFLGIAFPEPPRKEIVSDLLAENCRLRNALIEAKDAVETLLAELTENGSVNGPVCSERAGQPSTVNALRIGRSALDAIKECE